MHKGLLAWNIILTILLIAIVLVGYFQLDTIVSAVVPADELELLKNEIDQNRKAIQEVEALAGDNRGNITEQDQHMIKLVDNLERDINEVALMAESNRDNIFSLSVDLREVIEDVEQLKMR